MDIVSGPFIFLGPDFTKVREFYMALSHQSRRSTSRPTGSSSPATSPATAGPTCCSRPPPAARLYVNPKGEPRRWDSYPGVVPPAASVAEVSVMKDIDGDGKPDLVYMSGGRRAMGEARSGEPDRAVALDPGRRAGHVRRRMASAPATSTAMAASTSSTSTAGGSSPRRPRPSSGRTIPRPSAGRTAAARPAAPRCASTTSTATGSTTS